MSRPAIDAPELRARLALSHDEFLELVKAFTQSVPAREFTEEIYERALGYPWARPAQSFVLDGEHVEPLTETAPPIGGRHPLLAIGSNGSPEALSLKLGSLPAAEQRLLVVAGDLHDFDIGAAPAPTFYGSLPATLFPSPGTVVRASVLWVSDAQFTALAWSEITYLLGRLDGVRFHPDLPDAPPIDSVYCFVSRWGAHGVDGETVAMAAVPARGRAAPALTQEELLDHVAAVAFGEGASARDVVRRVMEDFGTAAATIVPALAATARPFACEGWTRFTGA